MTSDERKLERRRLNACVWRVLDKFEVGKRPLPILLNLTVAWRDDEDRLGSEIVQQLADAIVDALLAEGSQRKP